MLVTVVIATYNRPELLLEALKSVAAQSYGNWEVVVVDDGSAPPVNLPAAEAALGNKIRLVRHDTPQGVPAAKNAGVRRASGELIFHLDDDDLLAADALQRVVEVYSAHRELDCVFLNIEPFGKFAESTKRNQDAALAKVVEKAGAGEKDGVVFFGEGLFEALLKSVPLALQRPVARRGTWNMVGEMTTGLIFSEPDWAIRTALQCRTALLTAPLCKWRVDGQNFASRPEMRGQALEAGVAATRHLQERLRRQATRYQAEARQVRQRLGQAYFDKAYYHVGRGERLPAWSALLGSFFIAPGWKHARLGLRSLLPKRENET
ncbi:MAG: glycosyltransferase family 2 protein [Pseudomonadota bacterium]